MSRRSNRIHVTADDADDMPGTLGQPQSPPRNASNDREARLAALERRMNTLPSATETSSSTTGAGAGAAAETAPIVLPTFVPFDADHEKRQEFRRLVDPGIMRPNSKEVAIASLRTLSTMADNILREPNNPKFKQFKPTNTMIQRTLITPKGALEYAIALGFHPEVENFQPYYRFHDRYMNDLRIGAAIIKEMMQVEVEKQEREEHKREVTKAEEAARVEKAKKAFLDDRKSNMMRAQRESEKRRREQEQKPPKPASPQHEEDPEDE